MAKKKQVLTPEERLAAALVPEEKWPYALPEGWKWVYGKGFLLPMETEYPTGKSFRYIDIESIDNNVQRVRSPKKLSVQKAPSRASRKLHTGDTLFSMVRPYLKNIAYIDEECSNCIGSTGFYVCTPTASVDGRYLYWLMVSPYVVNGLNHFMKGDNSPSIRKGDIENFSYPLPPLSDQRRLVARIESLFAKLDAAREKVQSVLDSHETRKAALLHDAFTGKLTAKWRKERGVSFHAWHIEKLENLCEKITCGKTPKNDISQQGEIPYLKVYNIVNDKIDFRSKPQYIPREIHKTKLKSSILKPNDVVMNIVGPPLRKIAIIPDTYPEWNMNQAIVRFRPKDRLDYRFLYYALLNPETLDNVIQRTKGVVGQANISITQSRNLKIKVPSLPEQQEIIRILGRLLAREQRARQAAEETLTAIDRMKQSILARAFRGEL